MAKTLIISDIHLTKEFDQGKFEFLKNLFSKYDQIIINGDLWCNYSCTFDQFINSKWNNLFPYLKDKCIYLYGNHDRKRWCNQNVNLFSYKQAETYEFQLGEKTLKLQHGHKIYGDSIHNDTFVKWHRILKIDRLNDFIQNSIFKIFGKDFYNSIGKRTEKYYLEYAKNLNDNEILVIGHTHVPAFDLDNKYINTGYVNFGVGYFLDIEDNNIQLIQKSYAS